MLVMTRGFYSYCGSFPHYLRLAPVGVVAIKKSREMEMRSTTQVWGAPGGSTRRRSPSILGLVLCILYLTTSNFQLYHVVSTDISICSLFFKTHLKSLTIKFWFSESDSNEGTADPTSRTPGREPRLQVWHQNLLHSVFCSCTLPRLSLREREIKSMVYGRNIW
jgi:hypothetical protein